MTIITTAALFATMVTVSVVPGPSDFLVVGRSLAKGFPQGAIVTLGIIVADFLLIGGVILALGSVAPGLGDLFYGVQAMGGIFLLGLGIVTCLADPQAVGIGDHRRTSWVSSFLSGLLITLGDPKAIMFYLGLLPVFLNLSTVSLRDALTVMVAATAAVGLVKLSYAYLAAHAESFFHDSRARVTVNRIGGCVLVATGAYLVGSVLRSL